MKIAVLKIGARIAKSKLKNMGGTGESLSIIKMLKISGCDIDVYTKILDSDIVLEDATSLDIETEYKNINSRGYDALLVLNGNYNAFGGAENRSCILNYYLINNFNGKVFYVLCDCDLLLKQAWPSIKNKSWASNYDEKDIFISRKDIVYISQARCVEKIKKKISSLDIEIKDVLYFPLEKFPFINNNYIKFNKKPSIDLMYGGTFRQGKRESDMLKYYFGYDSSKYSVEMFGKIKLNNFKDENVYKYDELYRPKFSKSVDYNNFGDKMNTSISTVAIGDTRYKQWGDLAQRIYESIMFNNVVFIDNSYDWSHRVFKDKELVDFNYVNSSVEVQDRLDILKKDNKFREYLTSLQIEDTKIDINNYCNSFKALLEV